MTLENLIQPEILNDSFYRSLRKLAVSTELNSFLEIGSSNGGGSTQALVSGIKQRHDRNDVKLFCMEISKPRFEALSQHYSDDAFVNCYNVSSIPSAAFPSEAEVIHFYKSVRSKLNRYPLDVVLGWLAADLKYLAESDCDQHGIREIKKQNGIDNFDFVLIDGSEFTGERELFEVMGAKIIALDDVKTFKCWNAHQFLKHTSNYRLVKSSNRLRNGYSIFKRQY